ncbi:MAG: hypothetical protein C0613_09145 [Desulfobulbaceae bacterium]|nr:MAG: hypothetical protein C0613_09145 [Desulfobulbaceae bacterium]
MACKTTRPTKSLGGRAAVGLALLLLGSPFWPLPAARAATLELLELPPAGRLTNSDLPQRDPFNWPDSRRIRLKQVAEAEQDIFVDFILQAILWSPTGTPQAVINDQLVKVGDMVDGALITEITATRVLLTKKARSHTMQFDTLDIDFGGRPAARDKAQ